MKRNYECLYIIGSQVSDEKRNEIIAKFQKMAGTDATVDKWGMRKFATPIEYRKEGFYVLMNFTADAELIGKMSALMNITEGLVRYMFVIKDEKQIAYDAVRKVQRAENKAKFAGEPKAEFAPRAEKAERAERAPKAETADKAKTTKG